MTLPGDTDTTPVICGMGLRLPGATGADAVWRVLQEGRCTVTTVGEDLFDPALFLDPQPGRRGKAYTFACGRLDGFFRFDPGFFGISPREAAEIDPQQRLMLTTAWEAVEDAGLDMARLAGKRTGVFIGSALVEHLSPQFIDTGRIGSAMALGNELSIIANRVSSTFGFEGPSFVLDTACSSGLYALHQAVAALQAGEIDTALVGGVHVLRVPGGFVGFSQARMLSPQGLCRAFAAGADGYVRAEAAVMFVLQRPAVARRMLSRVRGRVLATGIGTDGATSALMVPSAQRQEDLITEVFARTGKDPEDLGFYEAHGTGTAVGDPAEAASIGRALGQLRRAALPIGSAKTNFGHPEPAAGLVGLAKAVLAMEHRALPASLHCETLNPEIDFDGLNLVVNRALTPLPEGPLLAGINSFGFGGTNAVAFVASPETGSPRPRPTRPGRAGAPGWLLLSAQSPAALDQLAQDWQGQASDPEAVAAAGSARAELAHRIARPASGAAVIRDQVALPGARSVLAFGGNGAQVAGMGRDRHGQDPVWRAAFDDLAAHFAAEGVADLAALLDAPDLAARMGSPLVAQPLLVACMLAEAEALIEAGLRPAAVVGHSIGELVALHLAGAYDRAGLARIVATRSRAFEGLRGQGSMAVVALPEAEVTRALAALDLPGLVIAAVNGPRSVTLSGPEAALDRFARITFAGRRPAIMRVGVEVPYHSPALDPLQDRFIADLAGVTLRAPTLPVASATRGRMLAPHEVTPDYLWENARNPVRFADALRALVSDRPALLIEVSPRPVLSSHIRDLARYEGLALDHVAMTGPAAAQARVAALWTKGASVDRTRLAGEQLAPAPALPPTPMQEADYRTAPSADAIDGWGERSARGLAGLRPLPDQPLWLADFTPTAPGWVADHRVGDRMILPGAALAELALSAGAELWPGQAVELASFTITAPADVAGEGLRLQTRIDPDDGRVTLSARPRLVDSGWTVIARGSLRPAPMPAPVRGKPAAEGEGGDRLYARLAALGLTYGPAFRRLDTVQTRRSALRARLLPRSAAGRFTLDPTALDAAFHALAALPQIAGASAALVPVRIGQLVVIHPGAEIAGAELHRIRAQGRALSLDLDLHDQEGRVVARASGVTFAPMPDPNRRAEPDRWIWDRAVLRLPSAPVRLSPQQVDAALRRAGFAPGPMTMPMAGATGAARLPETLVPETLATAPEDLEALRAAIAAKAGHPLPEVVQASAPNRAAWAAGAALLRALTRRWARGERASVIAIGLPPPGIVAELAALARDGLTLHHPEAAARTALRQSLPQALRPLLRDAAVPGGADIALCIGAAPPLEALAPGGIALHLGGNDGDWRRDGVALTITRDAGDILPGTAIGLEAALALEASHRWQVLRLDPAPDTPAETILLRALNALRHDWDGPPPLVVLTGTTAQVDLLSPAVTAALRCLHNEAPERAGRLLSLDTGALTALHDWPALLARLTDEPALHLRGTTVCVDRLRLMPPAPPSAPALRLHQSAPGRFETLRWIPTPRRKPGPGEVEVAVTATGLNFRDVMLARGLLPERIVEGGASGAELGLEWAGHVLRGDGFAPGAAVFGVTGGAFASHLTLPAAQVHPVPEGLAALVAAGMPVAGLTAHDALMAVAGLQRGESVLIHGGAGGVGLAAIRIAADAGARVFATASSPDKRAIALAAGAEACFDSRSDSFVQDLRCATGGRGVDVVLNSLSGALMRASLACLAPFGRFVELGKRDFADNSRIGLEGFARGQSYLSYDLDQRLAARPQALRPAFAALAAGEIAPLPVTRFDGSEAGLAMAHMLGARHVGKIVVTPPRPAPGRKARRLRGAWVILGGTGGIGLALARHLLGRGAARVHLVSRHAEPGLAAGELGTWAQQDPRVTLHALDAAAPDALAALLRGIAPEGIVHAAMVLRDRLLRDLDPQETALVIRAKLGVALALETALQAGAARPRHVVFFTSAASSLGNPGQAAYAAANAAVEGVARALCADGIPALAIGWGPVSDGGVLARDARMTAQLKAIDGVGFLAMADLLSAFDAALTGVPRPDVGVGRFDWPALARALPALLSPAFGDVIADSDRPSPADADLVDALTRAPWRTALARAEREIRALIGTILRMPPEEVPLQRRLSDYGLDSLMALELRMETERRFGVPISALALSADTTGARLAVQVLTHLRGADTGVQDV